MFTSLINSYARTLSFTKLPQQSSFSSKTDPKLARSHDFISISKEAFLPEVYKNASEFEAEGDLSELRTIKEDFTDKDIRYFYKKKSEWLNNKVKRLSQKSGIKNNEDFTIVASNGKVSVSSLTETKKKISNMIKENPVIKKEVLSLNRLEKYLRTKDLANEYYKQYSSDPSMEVFEKYKNMFYSVTKETYNISKDGDNFSSYIDNAGKVTNWDSSSGFLSPPI